MNLTSSLAEQSITSQLGNVKQANRKKFMLSLMPVEIARVKIKNCT
jgi:hypothetical protein